MSMMHSRETREGDGSCEGKGHCYHRLSSVAMSNPPQYTDVCCQCGQYVAVWYERYREDRSKHGKYLPPDEGELA